MVIKCLPRDVCPVPNQHNQLGPVKSLFQKGTSNYGSQVPKVGLRRWSISPTDQEKTLKFIAVIRKCSRAKRWANFIYQKWRFFSVFPSIILTLPRCLQAKSGSKHPIWPPGTRVKNTSKTSWKIHRIFCWWNGQSQFIGHEKMANTWGNLTSLVPLCNINQASCTLYYDILCIFMMIYVSCLSNQKCSWANFTLCSNSINATNTIFQAQ